MATGQKNHRNASQTKRTNYKRKTNSPKFIFLILLIGGSFYSYNNFAMSNAEEKNNLPISANIEKTNITDTRIEDITVENQSIINVNNEFIEKEYAEIYCGDLILVNNTMQFNFDNGNEPVSVFDFKNNNYKVKDKNILLNQNIIEPLNNMMNDYNKKADDKNIIIVSGYRTFDFQQMLLENKISAVGEAEAKRWVAFPGTSEHHTGLALDFSTLSDSGKTGDFDGLGGQSWLVKNAYRYGFIIRYTAEKESITGVANEPWHFRYVGIPHAQIMNEKNMCFEEYMDYLKQFEYAKKHLKINGFEIYYVKADKKVTKIPVPMYGKYTVSGNNVDGFIITIGR